jgi:Tfp pilus assembly protein FimT
MKSTNAFHQSSRAGNHEAFSYLHLLAMIALLLIMAAISIPALCSHTDSRAAEFAAQRKAQEIAGVFQSGKAVGAPGFQKASSLKSALTVVGIGSHGAGMNGKTFFQVTGASSDMDAEKPLRQRAAHYLSWSAEGALHYIPEGGEGMAGEWSIWSDRRSAHSHQAAEDYVRMVEETTPDPLRQLRIQYDAGGEGNPPGFFVQQRFRN